MNHHADGNRLTSEISPADVTVREPGETLADESGPGETLADDLGPVGANLNPTLDGSPTVHSREFVAEPAATLPGSGGPAPDRRAIPVVAGYEIESELGRGSMGVVYRAREVRLNRPCALKMILAGAHAGPEVLVRFLAEAEAVARLQHPNIVQIHHVGEACGLPFFELEFVPGGSLDRALDGTPWDPRRAASLVEALARGIHEAHRGGVVHRDVKPANVLLAADGTPKITDFGLAKMLDVDSGLTRTESILGTPSYMAPEQADGRARGVGPASDVYSLGSILYELLVGRPPFRAATTLETLELVKNAEPVAPRRLVPRLSRDVETIAMVCLRKEPGRRFASAEALADDLRRFLDGRAILARRTGPVNRAWRWCRRDPPLAAAIGLAVAGLLAISALSTTLAIARTRSFEAERRSAEALRVEAAKLAAERGMTLIERREGASGLLWLAKALERDPEDKGGLRHAVGIAFARAEREQVGRLRANLVHKTTDDRSGLSDPVEVAAFRDRMAAIRANTPNVNAIAYHPEGRLALTGHYDGAVQPWDVATGKADGKPWNVGGRVTKLAFLDGGRKVLTAAIVAEGTRMREIRLWDLATRNAIGPPRPVDGIIIAIRPDGRALAIRHEQEDDLGSTIRVIDLETSAPLGPPPPHPYWLMSGDRCPSMPDALSRE